MTKEWVEKEIEITEKNVQNLKNKARKMPCNEHIKTYIDEDRWGEANVATSVVLKCQEVRKELDMQYEEPEIYKELSDILDSICASSQYIQELDSWYADKSKRFDGDIIITDPCYLFAEEPGDKDEAYDRLFDALDKFGIENDTLVGDWQCNVFDKETKERIGMFCADAGSVCVMPLEKVYEACPNFKINLDDAPKFATIVRDYHGDVAIKIDIISREPVVYVEGDNFISRAWF